MTERASFYQQIAEIVALPPQERHRRLAALHADVVAGYCAAVQAIDAEAAARPGPDGRSVAQVIGHIAEWDRYAILAAGEMLAGVLWPRIMASTGFIEPDGAERTFKGVHDFNAYHAERHASCPWEDIRDLAIRSAVALQALFAHPALLTPALLEQTSSYDFTLADTLKLTTPVGWYLWIITIEHEAVEHIDEVGWGYAGR
jgi:hypothetical protein